jgi:hypothetical protein
MAFLYSLPLAMKMKQCLGKLGTNGKFTVLHPVPTSWLSAMTVDG